MNSGKRATNEQRRTCLLGLLLVAVTLLLYWPATTHGFILFDDGQYVSENPWVTPGLSWAGLKWAFTSAYASNWHPLTWVSHMLDCNLHGLFPGGHHLTNIVIHAANTLLLFLVLKRMTKLLWPSLLVAALFGWHPLHVESVAWVAERKDVLSTLFLLLTLQAYARYAEQPTAARYALALVWFALGLMSKPMLVTLPCVLLLLDYWPLRRSGELGQATGAPALPWRKLIVEKIPFFALAFAACVVTIIAQRAGGAIRSVADVPYTLRVLNALTAYVHYIGKAIWPVNLCIYYLLPAKPAVAPAICAALMLVGVSWLAWRWRSQQPWFIVGWFWFLGTLVPVIGLVQVGSQAMADRYTYIPLIGLFIGAVWGLHHALENGRVTRAFGYALAFISLLACLALTRHQLAFWRDDVALFQRAAAVTPNNYFAEYELGMALANAGRTTEGMEHYAASLRINPLYEPAHFHLGIELAGAGKPEEAAFQFSEALKRDPGSEELHNDLGAVLAQQGRLDAAIGHFQQAIQINPASARPYLNYASVLQKLGQMGPAFTNYTKARALDPASPEMMDKLALFLATCADKKWRDPAAAVKLAENANELTRHGVPAYLSTLAATYAAAGNFSNAVATAESAQAKAREQHLPELMKKLERNLQSYRLGQNPDSDQ